MRKKGISTRVLKYYVSNIYCSLLLYVGLKRKHVEEEGLAKTLSKVFAKAEEVAGERETRMRRLELEAEERRREADNRRDERMMRFLAGLMQYMTGNNMHPPFQREYQTPSQPRFPQAGYPPYSPSPDDTYN